MVPCSGSHPGGQGYKSGLAFCPLGLYNGYQKGRDRNMLTQDDLMAIATLMEKTIDQKLEPIKERLDGVDKR